MAKHSRGKLNSQGVRLAIVAARFNQFIVDKLVAGAVDAIEQTGGDYENVPVYWVPGAFEIAQMARRVIDAGSVDGVICLGAVIRGATPHFDYVCSSAASSVGQVAASAPVPVTFGVLTCDTVEQAVDRAGAKAGNKGFDAAMATIEMVDMFKIVG